MPFEKDLFISYAHIDNKPLTPEQQGWITRFHASLEALLSMRMGGTARIWRDNKLQGNDVFSDEIVDQFSHTAVFVSVLTPRYLNSEWCNKEVAEFCKRAEESGGMVVANKARIFKVLKAPVDSQESLPQVVRDVLGYEFFTIEDGAPLELDSAYGEKFAQDYNRKVGKLAWDVSQLLKTMETGAANNGHGEQGPAKPTVYLAECSYDRKQTREILEGELRRHGYTVLPDHELPREEAEYSAAVEGLLKRCRLSVHLVGETYGGVPDGPSQKSVVVLQN
ncbi:MAG TPA: TIR domain-containing protein, partial [Pyrinomonadaceae bacterium]|nr:TIR domain-containing protein [Pyrinomonadaceae bacterium]